jgi:uncharacterized protein (DUF924 family)
VNPDARSVVDFWFGPPGSETYGQQRPFWFRKCEETDATIRARFGAVTDAALEGGLADWDDTPCGLLAHILVLDQFTRNIHRNTPRAFAGDAMARALARRLIDDGAHRSLLPVKRIFVYLPLEHAEDPLLQAESVALFTALDADHAGFGSTLEYAQRHQAVIVRFGRFPHRNAILGRPDTPAEAAYLAQPGSGF